MMNMMRIAASCIFGSNSSLPSRLRHCWQKLPLEQVSMNDVRQKLWNTASALSVFAANFVFDAHAMREPARPVGAAAMFNKCWVRPAKTFKDKPSN
jgi:hypothetical protein